MNYQKEMMKSMHKEFSIFSNVFKQQLNSSYMLENLINDLIDLAKIENNKFSLNYENYDLPNTIHETLEILLFQAN